MAGRVLWIAAAVSLALFAGAGDAAADAKYVGAKKCKSCHKKELMGDQWGKWTEGAHSKAFETLKGDKAAELAREKGVDVPPYESEKCIKCHVTGYGQPKSAFAKPLKASDGVQCEACHGPGKDYRKKKIMSDRDKALAKGMWEPGKDEKICTTCHNDESPSWDPAKGFDYEAAKKEIAHAIPEDVKGRYLELAKQRGEEDEEEDED